MRSSWCWALAALLAAGLGGSRAAALDFRDADSGWSLTLPDGWRPLTDEETSAVMEEVRQHSPGIQLTAAFRAGEADFPYLLVIELPVANASLDVVAASLGSQRASEKIQHAARTLDQTDVQIGIPDIDRSKKMVVMRSRTDSMQSLVALCPGRAVIVQLTGVFAVDATDRDLTAFQAITSSFRFDEGRGYAPIDRSAPGEKAFWMTVGLLIVIISGLVRASRRRARPPADDRWERAPN